MHWHAQWDNGAVDHSERRVLMAGRTQNNFIRTQRYELWRRLRWGAWLILVVNGIGILEYRSANVFALISETGGSPLAIAAALAIFILEDLLSSMTPFTVWWCVCTFLMSRSRREASFSPTRDLEYYRDKLGGVTATQVSMLADLRIEQREDAAATLLSLAMKGVISLDGGRVTITNHDALAKRPRSERLLAQFAASGQLDAATTQEWAKIAEGEAADGILLERVTAKSAGVIPYFAKGCAAGCVISIISGIIFGIVTTLGIGSLIDLVETIDDDYELVLYVVNNPVLLAELIAFIAFGLFMMLGFMLPLVESIRGFVENGDASKRFRRTALGEQVTECVYGIRNYLRDFTALSDADRSSLMLWDEFAVYALALGDNASAVDEILASRGIDRSMLGL